MKNLAASFEMIAYQNPEFAKRLVKSVEYLIMDGTCSSQAIVNSKIEEVIRSLGVKVSFNIYRKDAPGFSVEIPPLTKEHPFDQIFTPQTSNSMGRLLTNFGELGHRAGTVNLDNCTVTGIFTKIPHTMFVTDFSFLSGVFTAREVAACICHEVGHIITNFFFMLNTTLSVFITSFIANAAAEAKGDNERKVVFAKGFRILGIDNGVIDPLLAQTPEQNATTLQSIFINECNNRLRSETGYTLYEAKASEQIADMVAVKFGFGVDLAGAIEKFHRGENERRFSKSWMTAIKSISEVTIRIADIVTLGAIMPSIHLSLMSKPFDDLVSPYDNPKVRIIYMKRHLVQEIKNYNEMDMPFVKKLISDIDKIQKIADTVNPHESVVNYLQKTILPFGKRVKEGQDFQKQIESLIYNDAYVLAAKFKGEVK